MIAYDDETREVRYVSTHDKKFKNSIGLGIGDYLELKGSEVRIYPGWEIRGPAGADGWVPMIGFNSELTVLRDGKEVKMKRALGQYWLPAEQTMKIKIIGFVKGGN